MSPSRHPIIATLTLLLATFAQAPAQSGDLSIDPTLAAQIATIPAIDNHAHPTLSPPAYATDRNFDALPVDNMEPYTDPVGMRPDLAKLHDAWQTLFHFNGQPPLDAAGLTQLEAARESIRTKQGTNYSAYILDKSNIATMLANRVAMGVGVQSPRFRWVPYVDTLLFPLDNSALAAATPDRKQFFPLEDALRKKYLQQVGLKALPPTLDAYLKQLVIPLLEQQKANGAVAEKFEIAYLRSFGFDDVPQPEAARIYATLLHRPHPNEAQYKRLQDFLFRYIAAECGRLNLPVHLHTTAGGGGYFSIAGDNPLLLEPLFNDPRLRHTNFVLLHGGWPFVHEIGALLQKPNVYLDLSQQSLMISPRTMSAWLREWLELYPEKILYATDAYPYSSSMGWEEAAWIANRNLRESLGIALTGMLRDNEITDTRATELANMLLHQNAESLYKF
ncbi:amidohydrolase family protein [Tunturiibacter gelidoferens]|uniref:Putative TIM-barrel fold metal-dependent hydrolase n=1 Tax=Tunturiibacter lichenicola TaxID=2051959 RepID=A0A7Y9NL85_9BACT|nr:amidohydrolase family protein [Edaphobacter lichenicola]NYF51227.1 putative TIM-barrel fold metal-dependent hydrolase [Edaphobacter lichenicola]